MISNKRGDGIVSEAAAHLLRLSSYFLEDELNLSSSSGCNQTIGLKCECTGNHSLTKIRIFNFYTSCMISE